MASQIPVASPPPAPRVVPGAPIEPAALTSGAVANATAGQPSVGPASGPQDPTSGPTPTPSPGPNPTPSPTPTPTPTPAPGPGDGSGSPASTDGAGDAGGFASAAGTVFLDILRNAVSPDALEAQNIILRRIALEGDVVPSRVPAPRNITEIGGYLNLLTDLGEVEMRSQVLAGILGVAGPNPPLGWVATATPLTFTPLANDRPAGPGQSALPVTIPVRSDFAGPLRAAMTVLHDRGCLLPFLMPPLALPPPGALLIGAPDPLDYIGRVLTLAATYALTSPAADPIVLARPAGTAQPFGIAARGLSGGPVPVPPADYEALQLAAGVSSTVPLPAASLVWVAPILAAAGFAPADPLPQPTAAAPTAWARLRNLGGLVAGTTTLGAELRLLHSSAEIAASAFSGMQGWIWTGQSFAP